MALVKKFPSEASAPSTIRPDYLSPSSVKSYLSCSLRFFFERVAQIRKATTIALYVGKAIHATFFAKKAEKAEGESEVVVKKSRSLVKVYRNALALSLTNPKSILFYVSFFVQFIDPAFDNPAISYTILALFLECFSMAWMTLLITAGADLLKFFGRRPSVAKLGNTAMGSMFLLFASKLALDA